ncbi:DUF4876 domain-containing protein [Pedobacter psychrodurus]|uniref:DUF4876 domain-containing protein n=1 Tax=Pedobacter psychrodurus TaxID=2530456 RepID=A0A4R0PVN2_9SPHI|nr:DUF4876 domain-containing protein [Pedobacter psychrodurus]TCD26654.1 DUF4876 domain-containing protein [Pedobacter psychrodurus]
MKKILLIIVIGLLFSCKKTHQPDVLPTDLNVKVAFDLANSGYTFSVLNITVRIKSLTSGRYLSLTTNDKGLGTFNDLPAGRYDVDVSYTISAADYTSITGIITTKPVVFNATEKNKLVNKDNNALLTLNLKTGAIGNWLVKQVYYAGSDRTLGALYRDQFIEIYNNTDETMYADSLYISEIWGRQSTTNTTFNLQANGQYDWTKSLNMTTANGDPNTDFIYAKTLCMIPGNGTTYPVKPGQSIVVAQTALNHKSPFTGTDGVTISVRNPELTVDLSKADFEAYYGSFVPRPLDSDIDNPLVPNVDVLSYTGTDMILDNTGRTGIAIFKVDKTQDVKNWPMYNEPSKTMPSSTARKYYQIPSRYIIDAMEIQPNVASSRLPKKLGADLDAGFAFVPKGAYTSQSVIRKTEKIENGRVILKDTNNSTEDFDFLDVALPRAFK